MKPDDNPMLAPVDEAWQLFAHGDLANAIRQARAAVAADPESAAACAALGFFLMEAGERDEAAAVLLSARDRTPDYAPLHWYLGYLAQRNGDLATAAEFLQRACSLDETLDEAAYVLAWLLHDQGRLGEALFWAQRALARAALPERLLQTAWLLKATGQLATAVGAYREAIAAFAPQAPEQAALHLYLSQCLRRLDRHEEADAVLREGVKRCPHDVALRIDTAWRRHDLGDTRGALQLAHGVTADAPDTPGAWYLLGVLQQDLGYLTAADQAFSEALQREPDLADAKLRRAQIQYARKQWVTARCLTEAVLAQSPGHPVALALLAQVLLDLQETNAARQLLVRHLRAGIGTADLRRMLAVTQSARRRPRAAMRTLRRALMLEPDNAEVLRLLCWLSLEQGEAARVVLLAQRLVAHVPEDSGAQVLAALVFTQAGLLAQAEVWAERAVANAPTLPDTWRALSQVRLGQRRLDEAEAAVRQALQLAPGQTDSLRQLGKVLTTADLHEQALHAFQQAAEGDPANDTVRLELAQAYGRIGHFDAGLAALAPLLLARPDWHPALQARAQLMIEGGINAAVDACARLLRSDRHAIEAIMATLRLAGLGQAQARRLLQLVPVALLRQAWRASIEQAAHTRSQTSLAQLARAAQDDLDVDPWMGSAALYAASLSMASNPQGLARQAREWYRALKVRSGLARFPAPPRLAVATVADARPRIAYIAGQLHHSLLRRVLAAHATDRAQIYVYTRQPLAGLPAHVRQQPLDPATLAESCAANGIDVAIDTGGLHPFEGQFELLRTYACRVAPVQVAWLGCWGSAGGLFDALLTDEVSLPADQEAPLHEAVLRLAGGQWCWDPPEAAPLPGPPPVLARGSVTYGVTARSLRLDGACLDTFARVVAATPRSTIRFIGEVAADWPLRREILVRMQARRVAHIRVFFDPFVPQAAFQRWLGGIDVVLDSFPGNGGLSLLDPLWMGVPVVTLAGAWPGARQGASVLASLGLGAWTADTVEAFCRKAVELAANTTALREHRDSLRARILASPLVDGRRVAAQIEDVCARLKQDFAESAAAPDIKSRLKVRARLSLAAWLARPGSIELPTPGSGARPELSVIMVLFNQAGLSRGALQALADQRGVRFETIVVDNASTDNTPELLARVQGARILRNGENLGFLRAARQGAAAATGRHLLFLNNDAVLQEGALQAALRALRADPKIGALGARVVLTDGRLQEAGNRVFRDGSAGGIGRGEDAFGHAARASRSTDYVSGVFLMTPTPVWEALNGFDERFAPAYYEDTDYCVRVWKAGYRVAYEPSVLVEHVESASALGDSATLLMTRNRERFFELHADWLAHQPEPQPLPLHGDRWDAPDDRPRKPRVLFIDNEVPHTIKGGGLPRARLMLQALRDWPVTLFPLWEPEDDWRMVYASLPASVEVALDHGMAGLEAFLQQRHGVYDVLLVSRPPNLAALGPLRARRPDLFAGMRLVYDAEALFALREIARAGVQGRPLTRTAARARIDAELSLAAGASDVLVVSQRDARYFEAKGCATHILSHSVAVRRNAPGPARRRGLLFVGAVLPGTPNEDGLVWFIHEVMPHLRRRGAASPLLSIVGFCTSERVTRLAGPDVRLLGPQDVLEPHYDMARVFVAPARFAGGVPAKVIETAAAGLPAVASAVLARQLGWRDGEDIQGARDAASFAQAIALLLDDDERWLRQQEGAWRQCEQRYAPELFRQTLTGVLR
jgi:predicted O-linked N-acetylglucosamine transferase (SPINDLY family)/GT2 family glycosyltransferase